MDLDILVAKGAGDHRLLLKYANRHGLIAGATGTGKTVTLQVMAEGLSAAGVPVFLADVKGDLAGLGQPGEPKPPIVQRMTELGLDAGRFRAFPTVLWDLFGTAGHPLRATVSDLGALLLARLLDLNEVQTGVLNIVFRLADESDLLLLDLKDLQAMLAHVAENAGSITTRYGNVAPATVGTIQRSLLTLENQGVADVLGEPALRLDDLFLTDPTGAGVINILAADRLLGSPRVYATFLLWLLAELFENLPEAGDLAKPKLVLFFDEAHLLFDDAPKALVETIERIVRLIRSKGVGVFFVTQNARDIPEAVSRQLGNRVQHGLRAFTPQEQKSVRAVAETFRATPGLDVEKAILELGIGEAVVSFLDGTGAPTPVGRAKVLPPMSRLGVITPAERAATVAASPLAGVYDQRIDRSSAFERLQTAPAAAPADKVWRRGDGRPVEAARRERGTLEKVLLGDGRRQSVAEAMAKSVVRTVGSEIGRRIVRGVLGSLLKR